MICLRTGLPHAGEPCARCLRVERVLKLTREDPRVIESRTRVEEAFRAMEEGRVLSLKEWEKLNAAWRALVDGSQAVFSRVYDEKGRRVRPLTEIGRDNLTRLPRDEFAATAWCAGASRAYVKIGALVFATSPEEVRRVAAERGLEVISDRDCGLVYGPAYGVQFEVRDPETGIEALVVPRRVPYGRWDERGPEIERIRREAPNKRPSGEYGYETHIMRRT